MKFNFKLKDIQIADVKIGEVAVETELSINEMVAIRKEYELALENMPVYLQQLATGYKKFVTLNNDIEKFEEEQFEKMTNSSNTIKDRRERVRPMKARY
jgi:hypothetical protein